MRYVVKDRPVEEFDTDLQLPEWQLEPDDEYMLGDPEDYYFIDEQGNLIEPGRRPSEEIHGFSANRVWSLLVFVYSCIWLVQRFESWLGRVSML